MRSLESSGLEANTRIIYTSDHGESLGNRGLWGKSVMYEDSVAVPLIMSGPGLPGNPSPSDSTEGVKSPQVVATPVSLVDLYPTLIHFAGETSHEDDCDIPGTSLGELANSDDLERSVFSEYHDWSSITGMFMLRKGDWKLVEYPGYTPQLFNLVDDPREKKNLAGQSDYEDVLVMMRAELALITDVEETNRAAFEEQAKKIEMHGGREALLQIEDFGFTPAPSA